ncbi:MAG: hypothetical protein M1827_005347, partial [Pycnora praestabilis]
LYGAAAMPVMSTTEQPVYISLVPNWGDRVHANKAIGIEGESEGTFDEYAPFGGFLGVGHPPTKDLIILNDLPLSNDNEALQLPPLRGSLGVLASRLKDSKLPAANEATGVPDAVPIKLR